MAKIGDLLAAGRTFSFEFFPSRTDEAERLLEKTLLELEPLQPSFVSVTYGAGGTTRDRTREIVSYINRDTSMTAMPHLTCVAHTCADITDIVTGYRDEGFENILALGGDPPVLSEGEPEPQSDFEYALELVELVRSIGDFSIGVAAHPELHPRSNKDRQADRDHLATKLRAADFGVTQFFFRAGDYLSMVDDLAARGVDKPVVPGIMPVTNAKQVQRFAQMSGAEFPPDLAARLEAVADHPEEVRRIGVEVATQLCQELLDEGAPGLHFYTLNRSRATQEIYANLGLGPKS
ncbi:MAG: methylenetetrahydrofolate reductase [NAD(P)H] [Actinomycetota bacterium]|nr:methylenetetrahydrofolate reductase [NAD(P)H] [Actinomycetota bacterium]